MEQVISFDPEAADLYKGPAIPSEHKWVEPNLTYHLFVAVPSTTAKELRVKATDRFGNIYTQQITLG